MSAFDTILTRLTHAFVASQNNRLTYSVNYAILGNILLAIGHTLLKDHFKWDYFIDGKKIRETF